MNYNYNEIYEIVARAYYLCKDEELKQKLDNTLDTLANLNLLQATY